MTKLQSVTVISAIMLFLVLYFGCDTVSPEQKKIGAARAPGMVSTDISVLLKEAAVKLDPTQTAAIDVLDTQAETATDSTKLDYLKQLSGKWYEFGQPAIAGYYAQTIAEQEDTEQAWSIAGTTYSICLQRSQEKKVRDYCYQNAVQAFENAASLNADNPQHKVNLAVLYTENPPPDNPMKGVLQLRDLAQKYPQNASVKVNLGRLAIQTSQFEKAVERLSQALDIEPNNRQAICLLSQAYEALGDEKSADVYRTRCGN